MNRRRNCIKGFECGNSCISKAKDCLDITTDSKKLNTLVEGIINFSKFVKEETKYLPTQKEKLATELTTFEDDALAQLALSSGMNSFSPEEATITVGKAKENLGNNNLAEYAENLKNKYKGYKPGKKASEGSPNNRKLPPESDLITDPFTGKQVHEMYYLPGSKIRNVTDKEVDAVWDRLKSTKEGKGFLDSMFALSKGAPARDKPDRSELDFPGKGGTMRLRKSQLKALLEQVAEDEDGDIYIADPWSDDGRLKYFPDLDHIVPLAVGGTHGTPVDTIVPPTSGYHSDNFIWTSKQINQKYKGDRTIPDTVKLLEKDAFTKDKDQVRRFEETMEWDQSLAKEYNTKNDNYFLNLRKALERKKRDGASFTIRDRVSRQESDMFTKTEYEQLLGSIAIKKEKINLAKRVLDGLEIIKPESGGIDAERKKELKSGLTSKNKATYEQTLKDVGDILDNAAQFASLENLTRVLQENNVTRA